jgi:hypothetical protein
MAPSVKPGAALVRSVARSPSESLQRLKRGEISIDDYLDERTEKALDHVRGKVPSEVLATVRSTLREQIRTDPVLVELVRRATGQVQTPLPEDSV